MRVHHWVSCAVVYHITHCFVLLPCRVLHLWKSCRSFFNRLLLSFLLYTVFLLYACFYSFFFLNAILSLRWFWVCVAIDVYRSCPMCIYPSFCCVLSHVRIYVGCTHCLCWHLSFFRLTICTYTLSCPLLTLCPVIQSKEKSAIFRKKKKVWWLYSFWWHDTYMLSKEYSHRILYAR